MDAQQKKTGLIALLLTLCLMGSGLVVWLVLTSRTSNRQMAGDRSEKAVTGGLVVPVTDEEQERMLEILARPHGQRPRIKKLETEPITSLTGPDGKMVRVVYQPAGKGTEQVEFFLIDNSIAGNLFITPLGMSEFPEWRKWTQHQDRQRFSLKQNFGQLRQLIGQQKNR
jgi:hypothetical protein